MSEKSELIGEGKEMRSASSKSYFKYTQPWNMYVIITKFNNVLDIILFYNIVSVSPIKHKKYYSSHNIL